MVHQQDKKIWIISGTIIIAILLLIGTYAYFNQNLVNKSTIQAQGNSEITVAPDLARVYVGVSIVKPTAQEAQAYTNNVTNNVIAALKQMGISTSDIETESVSLYQQSCPYDPSMSPGCTTGWTASQNLKVKTSDFTKVGTIVDVAVNNGANQINSVEFYLSSSKENEYKTQAIKEATASARTKAEAMASGSGVTLGKVVSVSENQYYALPYAYAMKNDAGVAAVQESATILPQDVTVTANVNVVYEIY